MGPTFDDVALSDEMRADEMRAPGQYPPGFLSEDQREALDYFRAHGSDDILAMHAKAVANPPLPDPSSGPSLLDRAGNALTSPAVLGTAGAVAAAAAGAKFLADHDMSRRAVLAGAGVTAAAASIGMPVSAFAESVPAAATVEQAIMRRVSFGLNPALEADVNSCGGWLGWIDAQLAGVTDPIGDAMDTWFFQRGWTAAQGFSFYTAKSALGTAVGRAEAHNTVGRYRASRFLVRAAYSRRQLNERMVDFWFNHFNVPANSHGEWWEVEFDRTIRKNAMGTFYNLLTAVTLGQSMMVYLNADVSTKQHLNENLGRELLELHTVGAGAYSEGNITDSARILTGWTTYWNPTFARTYIPSRHVTGPVRVMGFGSSNSNPDGRAVTQAYLHYLAFHPKTAYRLAKRLVQYFTTDTPDPVHVQAVMNAYLASKTDIRATLRALFHHPAFATSGGKVANPMEDFLAGWRMRGITPVTPTWKYGAPDTDATLATRFPHVMFALSAHSGRQPLTWPTPDGFPLDSRRYENAGTFLTMFNMHEWLAHSNWRPGFTPAEWTTLIGFATPLPASVVVDRVAQYLWRQPADDNLRNAALAMWHLSDLNTLISPTDWRGTSLWLLAATAMNHPLMMTR